MSTILLLGDTQIERFPKEYIEKENIQVVNAGIKNIEILSYYNMLPKIFERIIIEDYTILQIGITNLLNLYSRKINQKDIENLVNNTKKIIYSIHKQGTSILVMPVYPTRNNKLNKLIEEYNYELAQHCYESEIDFLDIYELLLDENNLLKESYTNNGLKLNKTGYQVVGNQIKEYFHLLENNYLK